MVKGSGRIFGSLGLLILVIGLLACGGSGGDDDGDGYTGNSEPAALTTSNADTMSSQAYDGEELGSSGEGFSTLSTRGLESSRSDIADTEGDAVELVSAQTMKWRAFGLELLERERGFSLLATESGREYGAYSGYYDYTATSNESTGEVDATIEIFNYSDSSAEETVNGTLKLNVVPSQNGGPLVMSFTYEGFSLSYTDGTVTLDGPVDMTLAADFSYVTLTMNLIYSAVYSDPAIPAQMFKTENYTHQMTSSGTEDSVTISGRLYHSIHGYVDITTPQPFVTPTGESNPTSGTMLLTGAGNSSVRMEAQSDGLTYILSIDEDGDGTYETQESHSWT